ncbi:hypothetical protein [Pseudomonas sp. Pseusp97]|uniref:hypothetical protein n=1 Tax=Pseudomonas sp. Pseusp97 TaxID=3243065 RepID=UPI0039A49118
MKKKKLLIICDSHGTNWGCKGYASLIENALIRDWDTTTIKLPGLRIESAILAITDTHESYDLILIGLGNPDIHPRIPRKFILALRALGIKKARDSYFSVPPTICISYILRLPLFLLRLILIRLFPEFYSSPKELKSVFTRIIKELSLKSDRILIIPTFRVDHRLYGQAHNVRSREFNDFLQEAFPTSTIDPNRLTCTSYENHYNKDYFHFKQGYQDILSIAIIKLIENTQSSTKNEDATR